MPGRRVTLTALCAVLGWLVAHTGAAQNREAESQWDAVIMLGSSDDGDSGSATRKGKSRRRNEEGKIEDQCRFCCKCTFPSLFAPAAPWWMFF